MKVAVVACTLACICYVQAAQVFSASELFARAAAETSALGLAAEDVITRRDFSLLEFQALTSMSQDDFWGGLEAQLSASDADMAAAMKEHSFLAAEPAAAAPAAAAADAKAAAPAAADAKAATPAAAPAAAGAKKDGKKVSSPTTPALLTDADLAVADAAGKSPAESKEPMLPDADFAADSPYEFQFASHVIPAPAKTDSILAKAAKAMKKMEKQLKAEGKSLMTVVVRAERNAKKAVGEEDWIETKKLAKQAKATMKKVKAWAFKKASFEVMRAETSNIIDWEAAEHARLTQLQKQYVDERAARAKELRELADQYIEEAQLPKVAQLKAKALKALNNDLGALEKKALNNFVLKLRAALYKKFGQANVDAAVKKGGLKQLKKVTGDAAGEVLLAVAGHLPTVGPYIRAGLVPKAAGNTAFAFVRRW